MHVFIAGATGAVGRSLIPLLIEHGHEVTGTTRSAHRAAQLEELGAHAAVVDGLDRDAVARAVAEAAPDAIVHQMTALRGLKPRRMDSTFAQTNRLRTEGTDNLLAAARAAGVERFVAQSFAGWPYVRTGDSVKTEDAPLQDPGPKGARQSLAAIRHVERATLAAGGVVLRYGGFYGPGTGITPGGEQVELLRKRKVPIVGDGGGMFSFCHVEDAASATVIALEKAAPGSVFNVCDDEPAPVRVWLPALAATVGAPPPRRVPAWVGRLFAGEAGVAMMTSARGASNARIKAELDWVPRWPTWREGFPAAVAGTAPGTRLYSER
jgi:nucleoside-diphosphate-sugar epimerase